VQGKARGRRRCDEAFTRSVLTLKTSQKGATGKASDWTNQWVCTSPRASAVILTSFQASRPALDFYCTSAIVFVIGSSTSAAPRVCDMYMILCFFLCFFHSGTLVCTPFISVCLLLLAGFRHPGTYPKKPRWVFLGTPTQKNPHFYFNLILVYTLYATNNAILYCF